MALAISVLPCCVCTPVGDCEDSTIRMRLRTSGMYFSRRMRVCSSLTRRVRPTCMMRSVSAFCSVTVKASIGTKMGAGTAAGVAGGATKAVSYTHLDVYKRQTKSNTRPAPASSTSPARCSIRCWALSLIHI